MKKCARRSRWIVGLTAVWVILSLLFTLPTQADESTHIEPGMTRAEVVARWGDPPSHARSGDVEVLYYSQGREVFLQDGRVEYIKEETSSRLGRSVSASGLEERLQQWAIQHQDGSTDFSSWEERDMTFGESVVFLVVFTTIMLIMLSSMWRIFTKAGYAGWTSLVPIYNAVLMMRIAGKPGWWVLLMMFPLVNMVIMVVVDISLANQFGKNAAFGIGLLFLPLIFMPILAFGSAKHLNPV